MKLEPTGMVKVENLKKNYFSGNGKRKAKTSAQFAGIGREEGLTFHLDPGEIFGVIGPDGAGKTTLFRILASLLLPDSGTAKLCGLDVVEDYKQIRKVIGYMPGRFSLYQDLSVEENLSFFATVFNTTIQENYDTIKDIYGQIEPFKDRRAGALSGGMKQKLALSCAMIHKPHILILDEPTTGVDPVSRKEFWDMLKRLKQEGITTLVSTAYMDEASLCDRIALMKDGDFIATNTPRGIVDDYQEKLWSVQTDNMPQSLLDLRKYETVETCFAFGDKHHITVSDRFDQEDLQRYLSGKNYGHVVVNKIVPTIEDCFMALTNSTGDEH